MSCYAYNTQFISQSPCVQYPNNTIVINELAYAYTSSGTIDSTNTVALNGSTFSFQHSKSSNISQIVFNNCGYYPYVVYGNINIPKSGSGTVANLGPGTYSITLVISAFIDAQQSPLYIYASYSLNSEPPTSIPIGSIKTTLSSATPFSVTVPNSSQALPLIINLSATGNTGITIDINNITILISKTA